MSGLSDRMRGQARSVAGSVSALESDAVERIGKAARRKRHTRTALTATGVGAGVLAVGGGIALLFLGGDDSTADPIAPSPSSSVSASPEPTSSTSASAVQEEVAEVVPGFAPIAQLPAEHIPWEQVGPGWFAVDYHAAESIGAGVGLEATPLPQLDGGMSLVSPSGQWYAARTLDSLGPGVPITWDGANVWMGTVGESDFETINYSVDIIDLASAEKFAVIEDHPGFTDVAIAPAVALAYAYTGDGLSNVVVGASVDGMGGCSTADSGFWGSAADDMSFTYSPARGGQLVCFGPNEAGDRTVVTRVNVGEVANSQVISEFQYDIYHYSFVGWIDDDRFLFTRDNDEGSDAAYLFSYDLRDDSILKLDVSLYGELGVNNGADQVDAYFDRASQRHVMTRKDNEGWSVGLYDLDGAEVAALAGNCAVPADHSSSANVQVSGGRLMVTCSDEGQTWLFDMASGAQIGSWDVGEGANLAAFGHPEQE